MLTNEQIKKLLYNYPKLNQWIKDYEKDLENIREQLDKHYSVNASVISDMPKGTDISNSTLDKVIKIDKLKELYVREADYIAEKLTSLYEQKRLIDDIIPTLTPTQQFIVEYKYFQKLNWIDVVKKDPQKRTYNQIANKENGKLLRTLNRLIEEQKEGI
jgi:hypothetical protein